MCGYFSLLSITLRSLLFFTLSVCVLIACDDSEPLDDPEAQLETASMESVDQTYQQRCATCHGALGVGGVGKALDGPHLAEMSDAQIFMVISQGIGDRMPGFQDLLSSDEIVDLIELIRSWQSESESGDR